MKMKKRVIFYAPVHNSIRYHGNVLPRFDLNTVVPFCTGIKIVVVDRKVVGSYCVVLLVRIWAKDTVFAENNKNIAFSRSTC